MRLITCAPFCFLAAAGCASSGSVEPARPSVTVSPLFNAAVYDRIAVYVQSRVSGLSEGGLHEVEDRFMQVLLAKGYAIAARSDLDQILRELRLQQSEVTEQALARAGKVLNVPAVLLVSVNRLTAEPYRPVIRLEGQSYYMATAAMSARLISADLGEVVWVGNYVASFRVSSPDEREYALAPVALVLASGFPRRR